MRTNRRRNSLIKRIALGLAVAALAAPVAQARPGLNPSDYVGTSVNASDYGMPRPMPHDYALASGYQIEVNRAQSRANPSDKIEVTRTTQPRSTSPELVGRFGRPNTTIGGEGASWNVNWDDAGIGAGLAFALVLLGGGAALATRRVGRVQTA